MVLALAPSTPHSAFTEYSSGSKSSQCRATSFARVKALAVLLVLLLTLVSRAFAKYEKSSNSSCFVDLSEVLVTEEEYVDIRPVKSEYAVSGYYNTRGDFVAY